MAFHRCKRTTTTNTRVCRVSCLTVLHMYLTMTTTVMAMLMMMMMVVTSCSAAGPEAVPQPEDRVTELPDAATGRGPGAAGAGGGVTEPSQGQRSGTAVKSEGGDGNGDDEEMVNLSDLLKNFNDVEFKFEIGAGKEECFYEHLHNNTDIYLSFDILKGGDKNIDFFIRNPQGVITYNQLWQTRGVYEQQKLSEGTYEFCFDNTYSHFSSKLVNFYFTASIHGEIMKYFETIQKVDGRMSNISIYLENVHSNIRQSLIDLMTSRAHSLVDYYNISDNSNRVQYWSMLQCAVIISTTCLQIFFVRRLFRTQNVTPSKKPRA